VTKTKEILLVKRTVFLYCVVFHTVIVLNFVSNIHVVVSGQIQ